MACISWDVCIEEQICKEWYLDGSIYKTECGDWYNTGTCYTETYCEDVSGDGSGGGTTVDDGCDATYVRLPGDSASGSGGTCPCEVYGTCVKTDCAGVENGSAQWDPNCGCIGGTTGRTACPTPCNNFDYRVKSVLNTEGGFINDPKDPGGATNKGISWDTWQSSAQSILGLDPTLQNLQNLTENQAMEIYKTLYWDKVKADQINDGDLRYLIFDFNVNAGANAVKVLQRTLNQLGSNVSVDGGIGPETLTAINSTNKIDLYNAYKINRQAYYNNIVANNPSQSKWINGWTNRVNNFINKSVNFFTDVNC
jgi:lysozyme family protein